MRKFQWLLPSEKGKMNASPIGIRKTFFHHHRDAAQAIRQHELGYALIHGWMDRYERGKLNNEATEAGALKNKVAELERKVGQQAMEIDLLKKAREHYVRNLSEKSSAPSPREASANGAKS